MKCYILKEKKAKTSLFVLLSVRFALPLTSSKVLTLEKAQIIFGFLLV